MTVLQVHAVASGMVPLATRLGRVTHLARLLKKEKKSLHTFFLLQFHSENRTKPVNPLQV